jgi:hypothetical protein
MTKNPEDVNEEYAKFFTLNRKYNPVLETAWLVSNIAFVVCHHLHESRVDFWPEYVTVMKDVFFKPLMDSW